MCFATSSDRCWVGARLDSSIKQLTPILFMIAVQALATTKLAMQIVANMPPVAKATESTSTST